MALLLFFVFASIVSLSLSATPASYPLACRSLPATSNSPAYAQFQAGQLKQTTYLYKFIRGTKSYAEYSHDWNQLPEGTCTWMDRGVGQGEPDLLQYTSPLTNYVTCTTYENNGYRCLSGNIESAILDLGERQGFVQIFNVYNNNAGRMIVTSLAN